MELLCATVNVMQRLFNDAVHKQAKLMSVHVFVLEEAHAKIFLRLPLLIFIFLVRS